ncbi:MAG: nuclear transport factor 2 family protein [Blastocatellia bacterium]|nr:nuclear transport factor 2 family protein [Blastocatellia bacterium]
MKRIKAVIALIFLATVTVVLAGEALAYPPFMIKAQKYGAKDCTFCHVDPLGGPPWTDRGKWLIEEKERRKADVVDVDWLADYKPGESETGGASGGSVEQELEALFNELIAASKKKDVSVFDRLLAKDFIETNADGLMIDKNQILASVPELVVESYEIEDMKTRVFGDAAVMTFRHNSKTRFQGRDFSGQYLETLVWVKRDDLWQIVAAHVSRQ